MYLRLRVKYHLFLLDYIENRQNFEKYSNIKFNENSSGGCLLAPYRRTDMKKLIVIFRHFSNARKDRNMRRNAQLFVKSTSVKWLMLVQTPVYVAGDIL